jgi:hypothetical protein
MKSTRNLKKAIRMGLLFMLLGTLLVTSSYAATLNQTTLDITEAKGGFGKVSASVKNIGNETAENITMVISVKGGILGKINLTKICSGCGNCSNTIIPGAIKTESTAEAGTILGIGPITISVSAEASNAAKVEKTFTGFVLGPLVIIPQ